MPGDGADAGDDEAAGREYNRQQLFVGVALVPEARAPGCQAHAARHQRDPESERVHEDAIRVRDDDHDDAADSQRAGHDDEHPELN